MPRCPLPEGATRYRPPRPEAGAYLPGIPLRDTVPLAVCESFELKVEHDYVDARAYFALYRPEDPTCAEACGDWAFTRDGFELVRFRLPSEGSAPCRLYLWCQVVLTFLGRRQVLAPSGLCLDTKRHSRLDQEVCRELGNADVTTLMGRSGLPRAPINTIAKDFLKAYRKKLPSTALRPLVLGADFVAGGRSRAGKFAVLTLTASDPRLGEHVPLDFLRMPPGKGRTGPRSAIVQATKKVLLSVNAEDLLAIALDGEERLEKVMRAALRLAIRQNPALKKVRLVLDRYHVIWNALQPLRSALTKTVKDLDKKDPKERKQRKLLAQARNDLEKAPNFAVEAHPKRRKRLAQVFKHFAHLKPIYEAFNGLRRIYDYPGVESAKIAYQAWEKGLSGGLKQRFGKFRSYVKNRWKMFLDYFALKEETFRLYGTGYSLTSGFTEAMNREFKWRRKLARASSLEVLAARVLSCFEYDRVRRRAALKRARSAGRAEKEAQAKQKGRAAAKAGGAVAVAAQADLAADAAFLEALCITAPWPPETGPPAPG